MMTNVEKKKTNLLHTLSLVVGIPSLAVLAVSNMISFLVFMHGFDIMPIIAVDIIAGVMLKSHYNRLVRTESEHQEIFRFMVMWFCGVAAIWIFAVFNILMFVAAFVDGFVFAIALAIIVDIIVITIVKKNKHRLGF